RNRLDQPLKPPRVSLGGDFSRLGCQCLDLVSPQEFASAIHRIRLRRQLAALHHLRNARLRDAKDLARLRDADVFALRHTHLALLSNVASPTAVAFSIPNRST